MTGTYLFIGMLASMVMLSTSYDYCYISPLNTLCRFKVNMVFRWDDKKKRLQLQNLNRRRLMGRNASKWFR